MIDPKAFLPSKAFLTKGVGRHKEKLTSFELALRDAHVAQYNLVRVSSIFPPHCTLVSWEQGVKLLVPGQVVFAVVAEASTNEPSRLTAAAIGLAIPADPNHPGYIPEHHAVGQPRRQPRRVFGGPAVREAVPAAGFFRRVAADGAGDLAGRIGRVVQPQRRHVLRDPEVRHARLHPGREAGRLDLGLFLAERSGLRAPLLRPSRMCWQARPCRRWRRK